MLVLKLGCYVSFASACVPNLVLCIHTVNVRCSGLSTVVIKPVIIITIFIIIIKRSWKAPVFLKTTKPRNF